MSRVRLSGASSLELRRCFAGLDALVPRVTQLGVTSASAVSEPRTAEAAATDLARFPDSATGGTFNPGGNRPGCYNLYMCTGKRR